MGVEGRIISDSLRYGLCELQCPDYFSGLKPRAVGTSYKGIIWSNIIYDFFLRPTAL